jgi:citrate lyase subunit gamma (acyl carrier protein)
VTSRTVPAQAGSLESGDLLVFLRPRGRGDGLSIQISSPVKAQFGEHIARLVKDVLAEKGIRDVDVVIDDRGALDYAIRARVVACVERLLSASPCSTSRAPRESEDPIP